MKILKDCFIILILIFFVSCEKENEVITTINQELEEDVLILINNHRKEIGLDTLIMNNSIREISRNHSKDMATGKKDFGHDGFESRYDILVSELGNGSAAENVAAGYTTAQAVVNAWLESEGHRENIEGDYNLSGIGIVADEKNYNYFTQIFFNQQ